MAASARVVASRRITAQGRRRRLLHAVGRHSVALFFTIVFVMPFVFVVLTSLMTRQQALTRDMWPHPFAWGNYSDVFRLEPILRYTWVTVVYAVLATVGVVLSSVPVAYALSPWGLNLPSSLTLVEGQADYVCRTLLRLISRCPR